MEDDLHKNPNFNLFNTMYDQKSQGANQKYHLRAPIHYSLSNTISPHTIWHHRTLLHHLRFFHCLDSHIIQLAFIHFHSPLHLNL